MENIHTRAYAASSWPTPYGQVGRPRSTTAVTAAVPHRVRWSVPLPDPQIHSLIVDVQGNIIAASDQGLVAVHDGQICWTQAATRVAYPLALHDGRMLVVEDHRVVVRDGRDGHVQTVLPLAAWGQPAISDQGLVVARTVERPGQFALRVVTLEGQPVWSVPLGSLAPGAPLLIGDRVLVADDGLVSWTLQGEAQCSAKGAGGTRVLTPLMVVGDGVLIGQTTAHRDQWLYAEAPWHALASQPNPLLRQNGVAVATAAQPVLIGSLAPQENARGVWQARIAAVARGETMWEHTVDQPVGVVLADGAGAAVIVSSPTTSDWAAYSGPYGLAGSARVWCVDPAGNVRWEWAAPGPLLSVAAIGADGAIYVVADGKLWALAG